MNLRGLWDTVVLRDVLGYTLPGVVTLSALGLLWLTRDGLQPDWCRYVHAAVAWKSLWWPIVAAVLALGFVVGHLQIQIIGFFEHFVPGWNLGKLTLRYLSDPDEVMGEAYCEAAAEFLHIEGELCKALTNCKPPDDSGRKDDNAKFQAKALWRLCDYYVLVRDSDSHATYMGRYYVLAVLFSNLGLSAILLAVCLALLLYPSIRQYLWALLAAGIPGIVFCLVYWLRGNRSKKPEEEQRTRRKKDNLVLCLEILLIPFTMVALLGAAIFPEQVLPATLLLLGLVLIYWSGRFRRQFVERAFPIFYVLRQLDIESTRDRPTPSWRACLSTGIGAAAFGYWLRGRATRKVK